MHLLSDEEIRDNYDVAIRETLKLGLPMCRCELLASKAVARAQLRKTLKYLQALNIIHTCCKDFDDDVQRLIAEMEKELA